MCVILITGFCGQWEGWVPVNQFNNTSWMTVVTPTDHPKSVRNQCVIEVFGGDFVLSVVEFSVCIGVVVIGLSQISFFFSHSFHCYLVRT